MKSGASTEKRTDNLTPSAVQEGSRQWWSRNPMTYDWHRTLRDVAPHTREWFDTIDERFLSGARLFATERRPFDRMIPFELLKGARVLEIGCGSGLHTELMAAAGAEVTAVDLTLHAIEATRKRLALKGLSADVIQADAESLPLDSRSFDFVWSWGVIHHSARTGKIVREISRIIKATGECRVMVYNRLGMSALVTLVRDHLLKGGFLRSSFDETLYACTDGFSARYYTPDQFEDLFRAFFQNVTTIVCGQDADAIPLPGRIRAAALRVVPERYLVAAQAKRGSFLFLTARDPW